MTSPDHPSWIDDDDDDDDEKQKLANMATSAATLLWNAMGTKAFYELLSVPSALSAQLQSMPGSGYQRHVPAVSVQTSY